MIGREAGYTLDRAITEGQITIAPPGRKFECPERNHVDKGRTQKVLYDGFTFKRPVETR